MNVLLAERKTTFLKYVMPRTHATVNSPLASSNTNVMCPCDPGEAGSEAGSDADDTVDPNAILPEGTRRELMSVDTQFTRIEGFRRSRLDLRGL